MEPSHVKKGHSASKVMILLLRPVTFLTVIAIGAITTIGNEVFERYFSAPIWSVVETGDAIRVDWLRTETQGPDTLTENLSPTQRAELQDVQQQGTAASQQWLTEQGIEDIRSITIQMALSGNRKEPARVIDIRPSQRCWMHMGASPAIDESLELSIDMDASDPEPTHVNESGQEVPFFPAQTIKLGWNEQQLVIVTAEASKVSADCPFELLLTVLEGSKTYEMVVNDNGKPFSIPGPLGELP